MSISISPDSVLAYREGRVMNDIVCNLGCCCPSQDVEQVFSYIEIICKDGTRLYAYEDDAGYRRFEEDFHKRRFTSFHEFWTTQEAAEEQRDLFTLKYYVRRPESSYIKAPLDEIRARLDGCRKLQDRITAFHQYDRKADYHCEDL